MSRWATRITSESALESLRGLLARRGRLSAALINSEKKNMPCSTFYEHRFGGLIQAYALAGYVPGRDYGFLGGHVERRRIQRALRQKVAAGIRERGLEVQLQGLTALGVGRELRMCVLMGPLRLQWGKPRWYVQCHLRPAPDWVLIACLAEDGTTIQRYAL